MSMITDARAMSMSSCKNTTAIVAKAVAHGCFLDPVDTVAGIISGII